MKTDRRDAERLARGFRAGDLSAVWVPDESHEALRDLVREREAAKQDQLSAHHLVGKYLLRHGRRRPPERMNPWTYGHLEWIKKDVRFDQYAQQVTLEDYLEELNHQAQRIARLEKAIDEAIETAPPATQEVVTALQTLRGIGKLSAVAIVSDVGQLFRFPPARQAMADSALVASEHSSGERKRRCGITKPGNAHLLRMMVEAAWAARFQPSLTRVLRLRQEGQNAEVLEIVHELVGFVWVIGRKVEARHMPSAA